MERFAASFAEWRATRWSPPPKQQAPKALVVACADSRVSPQMLTSSAPGEIFTVRNVANLVPPYQGLDGRYHGTTAAMEYAVRVLKVPHIIVMGHKGCGGVRHAVDLSGILTGKLAPVDHEPTFVSQWVSLVKPAIEKAALQLDPSASEEEMVNVCEHASVNNSLYNLLTFPWIRAPFTEGSLRIHGWYYDMEAGRLERWELKESMTTPEVLG